MSDSDIILLLKKKDKEAIRLMYVRYSPVMLVICMRYALNRNDAKDLMHEGFIKILTRISSYKGEGSLEGWLKRVMVNSVLDTLKKQKAQNTYSLDDEYDISEEETVEVNQDYKDIGDARPIDLVKNASLETTEIIEEVEKLPTKYKMVFTLFVLDELSHREIAKHLKIDEKVSRIRLSRARDKIKQALYEKSILRLAK